MRGLFVTQSGWSGGTILTNIAPHGSDTFDIDTELASDVLTHYEVATAYVAWFNDAGRPWSGAATGTFVINASSYLPQFGITLTSTLPATWTSSANVAARMQWAAVVAGVILNSTAGVVGSLDVTIDVEGYVRYVATVGPHGGAGGYVPDNFALATRQPSVTAYGHQHEMALLAEALDTAGNPRAADIYHKATAAWLRFSLGGVEVSRIVRENYSATLAVIG